MIIRELGELPAEPVSHDPAILKRVLLRKGDVPDVLQLAEAVFLPGQVAAAHSHETMRELFLCRSGEGRMAVDGAEFRLTPGTFAVCDPGESHEIENDGMTPLVLLVIGLATA